jgi:hypothetical protein
VNSRQRDEKSNGNESLKCCAEFHVISFSDLSRFFRKEHLDNRKHAEAEIRR